MTLHQLYQLLFNFKGRINRAKFWLGLLLYLLATAALWGSIFSLFFLSQRWLVVPYLDILLAIVVVLIAWFWLLAVGTKRLHDRGKSGAWMLVFMVPAIALMIASVVMDVQGWIATGLSIAEYAFLVWALIELGIVRGTAGPNQYGNDPLVAPAG